MPGEDYKLTAVFEKTEEFTLTLKVCSGCDDCGGIQNQIIDSKTQFATNGGKYVKGTEVSLEVKITEDKSKFVK